MSKAYRFVVMSDTHSRHKDMESIPNGDFLIHAGDVSGLGRLYELEDFASFINTLPHPHKIVIAGNHDPCFEKYNDQLSKMLDCHYLVDEQVVINGISIYGSPWTPCHWAYHAARGEELKSKWLKIPKNTDILITHMPPYSILDYDVNAQEHHGCEDLLQVVFNIRPKYHIYGHVHSQGLVKKEEINFINASISNEHYKITNSPICFDYIG